MRIIVPVEFSRSGGVEHITISLVSNLINHVEQIILVLQARDLQTYRSRLPQSEKICYETFQITPFSREAKLLLLGNRLLKISKILHFDSFHRYFNRRFRLFQRAARIQQLIEQYQADYCLYTLINRLEPPELNIPLCGISHDLFWRFSSLTYPEDYIKKYDEKLVMWLEKAKLIFAVSQKTNQDILTVFPNSNYSSKIQAIPWSGYPPSGLKANDISLTQSSSAHLPTVFYFPSSFGIYKDHLTLLKAGIILAQKGLKFKIILVGRETDGLVQGNLKLSQQAQTQEYVAHVKECQNLYTQYQSIFKQYFEGLGYCDYDKVEYLYQNSSCVVMPSKYEGFGLAVSEAIVRGLPVIASDLEVFREQVALYQCPDRVQFFPLENAEALAKLMEEFIKHPQQKLTPLEIQERFSHWTWNEVAQEYIKVLQTL